MKTNNALLFLSLVLFLVAAALSGCKSKKTIINQKTDDKITENIEYNDTIEDSGTIVIKTTRIDSNTTKKEIFINNRKINRGKKRNSKLHLKNDTALIVNGLDDARNKQQIKDLKKQNKSLEKIAKVKVDNGSSSLKKRLIIVFIILILLFLLKFLLKKFLKSLFI